MKDCILKIYNDLKKTFLTTWYTFVVFYILVIILQNIDIGTGIYVNNLELGTKVDVENLENHNTNTNTRASFYILYKVDNNITSEYHYTLNNTVLEGFNASIEMVTITRPLYKVFLHYGNVNMYRSTVNHKKEIRYSCSVDEPYLLNILPYIAIIFYGIAASVLYKNLQWKIKYYLYYVIIFIFITMPYILYYSYVTY